MSELRTSIILDLAGNLDARARRYTQALGTLANGGRRHMSILSGAARAAGQALDGLGNRYTALLSGAGAAGTAKMVMDLQTRFTRLGIQADISDDQVQSLKREIYELAQAPDIRVDPGEITSAIEAIVEKTGDLKFAQANIRNIGLAIQATGAAGGNIGEILGEFQKMGIIDPSKVMEALDILNVQGKAGAFTLQNIAALGPRVITAYTATGREGVQALREMGAALQVIRMGTGSSEMAATAFEATLRTLADPRKVEQLKEMAGIDVWEKTADGGRRLRAIDQIMTEIVTKAKGDKVVLGSIFDAEAVRAFNQAAGEFQRTGAVNSLQQFMGVQADGSATMRDSARAAKDASQAMTNLYTAWKKFADESLTGPIQDLADLLNQVGSETTGKVIKGAAYGAAGIGGLVAGRKIWNAGKGVMGMFGKGGGAASAVSGIAGALGAGGAPIPVYVVNKHLSMLPGQDGFGLGGGTPAAGKAGGVSRWSKLWGRMSGMATGAGAALSGAGATLTGSVGAAGTGTVLGGAAVAGGVGYGIGTLLNDYVIDGTAFGDKIGETLNRVAAALGSQESKLAIEINTRGDATAKVTSMSSTGVDMDVDTGLTMGAY